MSRRQLKSIETCVRLSQHVTTAPGRPSVASTRSGDGAPPPPALRRRPAGPVGQPYASRRRPHDRRGDGGRRDQRTGRRRGTAQRSGSSCRRGPSATPARGSRCSPRQGVPRDPYEKIADAAQVHRYTGVAPTVALHIPWDKVDDYADLRRHAADVRRRPRDDQLEHVPGRRLHARQRLPPGRAGPRARPSTTCSSASTSWTRPGSRDLKLWFADGTNYPGQDDIRGPPGPARRGARRRSTRGSARTSGWCSSTSSSSRPSTRRTCPTGAPRFVHCVALGPKAQGRRRHRPPRAGHEHRVHRRVAAARRTSSAASTSTRASTPTTT